MTTLKLAKGFRIDSVPGQRVYSFLGTLFLTNQSEQES